VRNKSKKRKLLSRSLIAGAISVVAAAGVATSTGAVAGAATTTPATCAAATLIVARGTFEPGTLGIVVGDRLADDLKAAAPGKFTFQAVDYPANTDATSPPAGDKTFVADVNAAIARCPTEKIFISGYSQGAQVVDEGLGYDMTGTINGGPPTAVLPSSAASHIAGIVLFGNPLGSLGKHITGVYGPKTDDFCAGGDPVCTANAINIGAHLSYWMADDAKAAAFIESKL
jgi:cutinase